MSATTVVQAVTPLVGERWEIVRPLAEGGMGTVYVARHHVTGRLAALKILRSMSDDPGATERFRREACLASIVGHPGIVEVFDADRDEATGQLFIAMELLTGRTLREHLADPSSTTARALIVIAQMLEPLAAAHAKGVTHRDLKPENVFVTDGPTARVKLLDFGIARPATMRTVTDTGTVMGTPNYMSPEQACGAGGVGPASDVWSVGIMLYEVLTGAVPFRGDNAHGVVVAACTREHEPIATAVPDVNHALAALVDRCLAKDARRRPPDAQAVHAELCRALGRGSVPSPRVSRPATSLGGRDGAMAIAVADVNAALGAARPRWIGRAQGAPIGVAALAMGALAWIAAVAAVASDHGQLAAVLVALGTFAGAAAAVVLARRGDGGSSRASPSGVRRDALVPPRHEDGEDESELDVPVRGNANARLRIDLFADLSSPSFGAAHAIAREIDQRYAEVCITYRPDVAPDRPMAWIAAETLYEVLKQCGNTAALRLLERIAATRRRPLTQDDLERYAEAVGARRAGLRHALKVGMHRPRVEADFDHARTQGVRGVATFVVDGRAMLADMPLAIVFDIVDEALTPSAVDLEAVGEMGRTAKGRGAGNAHMRFQQIVVRWTALRSAPVTLVRTRAEANDRTRRLLGRARMRDADFAGLARRFGDGGAVVILCAEELPPPARRRATRLAVDEISDVVASEEGFHIIKRTA